MRAGNTFGVDFIIRLDKRDKSSASLFARVTVDGEQKEISLKQKVKAAQWDSKSEALKGKGPETHQLNAYIDKVRFLVTEKYRMLKDKGDIITAEAVKFAYLGQQTSKHSGKTILELLEYHTNINNIAGIPIALAIQCFQ